MKKVLIVAEAEIIRRTMLHVMGAFGYEPTISTHEEALGRFLELEPEAVIVFDYEEDHDYAKGKQTYRDIKGAAAGEKVFCTGFSKSVNPDFIPLLEIIPDLLVRLEGEK